jgi:MFS family permease
MKGCLQGNVHHPFLRAIYMINHLQGHESNHTVSPPWGILMVVLLAGMASPFNVYKVSALMPILMKAFHVSGAKAGLLMSIFSIAGLLIALPAGFAFRKLGARVSGSFSMAFIVLGSILGSLSTSAVPLLITRFIEGIGVTMIAVIGPAIVSNRFSGKHRATAMGIWLAYVPLGSALSFGLIPFLGLRLGWEWVWRTGSLYALCAGILFVLFVKPVKGEGSRILPVSESKPDERSALGKVLANRNLLLYSLLYCSFAIIFTSFLTWTPTYLFTMRHQSLALASTLAGLIPTVGIIGSPVAGYIFSRIRSAKTLLAISVAFFGLSGPMSLYCGTELLFLFVIVIGFVAAFVPTGVSLVAANIIPDNRDRGMAMSIISMGFNLGSLIGPVIFGFLLEHLGGWQSAYWLFIPIGLAGAALGLATHTRAGNISELSLKHLK